MKYMKCIVCDKETNIKNKFFNDKPFACHKECWKNDTESKEDTK